LESTHGLRLGQLVRSRAGRDAGRLYAVVGILDERFVKLADGKSRPIARAKKKNVKHVVPETTVLEEIARKLEQNRPVTDAELREALAREEKGRSQATQGGLA